MHPIAVWGTLAGVVGFPAAAQKTGPTSWQNDLRPVAAADWNYDFAEQLLNRGIGGTREEIQAAGRNLMMAPGYWWWDFGVHKDFRLTENFGLTFRSEFFNLLNKANFAYLSTSTDSVAAGTITSIVGTAGQIQFAQRLHW